MYERAKTTFVVLFLNMSAFTNIYILICWMNSFAFFLLPSKMDRGTSFTPFKAESSDIIERGLGFKGGVLKNESCGEIIGAYPLISQSVAWFASLL
jgi:hypothetical protein